jgi:hypothetical protein
MWSWLGNKIRSGGKAPINTLKQCKTQGNSTKGRLHRDVREHYDVMGASISTPIAPLLPALCSDWLNVMGSRLHAQLHPLPYVELPW